MNPRRALRAAGRAALVALRLFIQPVALRTVGTTRSVRAQ